MFDVPRLERGVTISPMLRRASRPAATTAAAAVVAAMFAAPTSADGYVLNGGRPSLDGPEVTYWNGLRAYEPGVRAAVAAVNRARVGIKLVPAPRRRAYIRFVGLLPLSCNTNGEAGRYDATAAGWNIRFARGCNRTMRHLMVAHELGHVLGLLHEERTCAVMNSWMDRSRGAPHRCVTGRFDWHRSPFRRDDLRGLRRMWRNTPPQARISPSEPEGSAGAVLRFDDASHDAELNIVRREWDFGDPTSAENRVRGPDRDHGSEVSHAFAREGVYRITLTVTDSYGRRDTTSISYAVGPYDPDRSGPER